MCTGFVYKGNDYIVAYNLDIDPKVWNYSLIKKDNLFSVSIKVGSTRYLTHGINSKGVFAVLPYMNDTNPFIKTKGALRVDLLVDRLLNNKILVKEIADIEMISNLKNAPLHALISDDDLSLLIEPGIKPYKIINKYQVISNYPLLKECLDESVYYGKDRYKIVDDYLKDHDEINYLDALNILKKVKQEGQYSTKLSFVYSKNNNSVYYVDDENWNNIKIHSFIRK